MIENSLKNIIKESTGKFALRGWLFLFVMAVGLNIGFGWFVFYCVGDKTFFSLVGNFLGVSVFRNYAFAFSLPVPVVLIYIIYFVIFGAVGFYLFRQWKTLSVLQKVAWFLVLCGGVSNVVERAVSGYVRDFLYIYGGAILNLADLEIFLGVLLLLLWETQHFKKKAVD